MITMMTERCDDDKYYDDETDSPLLSSRLHLQCAHCYHAEAGCLASLPVEDCVHGDGDGDCDGDGDHLIDEDIACLHIILHHC